MSDISSAVPFETAPRRATGFWLVGVLGLAVFVLGVMLVASAASLSGGVLSGGLPVSGPPGAKPDITRLTVAHSPLPGFERRGNTLVGEVTTRDGATLRLVFDARTNALIGLRRLDEAPR